MVVVFLVFTVIFVIGLMVLTTGLTRDKLDILSVGLIISGGVVSFSFGYLMYEMLELFYILQSIGLL
jgi:hypothetical protein